MNRVGAGHDRNGSTTLAQAAQANMTYSETLIQVPLYQYTFYLIEIKTNKNLCSNSSIWDLGTESRLIRNRLYIQNSFYLEMYNYKPAVQTLLKRSQEMLKSRNNLAGTGWKVRLKCRRFHSSPPPPPPAGPPCLMRQQSH